MDELYKQLMYRGHTSTLQAQAGWDGDLVAWPSAGCWFTVVRQERVALTFPGACPQGAGLPMVFSLVLLGRTFLFLFSFGVLVLCLTQDTRLRDSCLLLCISFSFLICFVLCARGVKSAPAGCVCGSLPVPFIVYGLCRVVLFLVLWPVSRPLLRV